MQGINAFLQRTSPTLIELWPRIEESITEVKAASGDAMLPLWAREVQNSVDSIGGLAADLSISLVVAAATLAAEAAPSPTKVADAQEDKETEGAGVEEVDDEVAEDEDGAAEAAAAEAEAAEAGETEAAEAEAEAEEGADLEVAEAEAEAQEGIPDALAATADRIHGMRFVCSQMGNLHGTCRWSVEVLVFLEFAIRSRCRDHDVNAYKEFLDERKKVRQLLLHCPAACSEEANSAITAAVTAASGYHEMMAKSHHDSLGQDFLQCLAIKHTSSTIQLVDSTRAVLHFGPWALLGKTLKAYLQGSLQPEDQDAVHAKVQQIAGLSKLHEHGAILLATPAARRQLQFAQRFHTWQVSAATAAASLRRLVAQLMASGVCPGGCPGSSSSSPASISGHRPAPGRVIPMPMCEPAVVECTTALLDAQSSMQAVAGIDLQDTNDGELAPSGLSATVRDIIKSREALLGEAKETTHVLLETLVSLSCDVLLQAGNELQGSMPLGDISFMLLPAGQRDNNRILSCVLNDPAVNAAITRSVATQSQANSQTVTQSHTLISNHTV